MAFSETTKEDVKKKAHYNCCVCKNPFPDVHHIIPEGDGGDDSFDNAAPLCGACHRQYGNNSDLRKTIKGMRNLWYEICATRYKDDTSQPIYKKIDELGKIIAEGKEEDRDKIDELKKLILSLQEKKEDEIKKAQSIEDLSKRNISATKLGNKVFANVACRNCGTSIGLLIGTNRCPNCKQSLE